MRDETGPDGLKLTIDLKRGVDPEKLMQKLFRLTPLQDTLPLQLQHPYRRHAPRDGRAGDSGGVDGLAHGLRRSGAVFFQTQQEGRQAAPAEGPRNESCWTSTRPSRIIRETEQEEEVVPNLMIGFGIDEMQAEYVAEIKLRNINKEYILKRTAGDRRRWKREIADLERHAEQPREAARTIIIEELQAGGRQVRPAPAHARSCMTRRG